MNVLRTVSLPAGPPCPRVEGRARIAAQFAAYLTDESRTTAGPVEVVFFPEDIGHVCRAVEECAGRGMRLTVAGARTGIVGGAVPVESEAVLALERLNHIRYVRQDQARDCFFAGVEAGVVLADLQRALRTTPLQELPWADERSRQAGMRLEAGRRRPSYPVDPTETSAQIGGTVATNASGARTFHYGPTRAWVEAISVVTAAGEVLRLRRGEVRASQGCFILASERGAARVVPLPHLKMPATKHAAGYYLRQDMDAVDLFVGSEGTLGIVVEAELRLTLEPPERLLMTCFLPSEADALGLVQAVRQDGGLRPVAIEYMDGAALELLGAKRAKEGASSGVPPLPEDARAAVYLELDFDGDAEFRRCYGTVEALLRRFGSLPRRTWAGLTPGDLAAMKAFRHALPEYVNSIIGACKLEVPAIHKVGTDMAVPDERLAEVMSLYRDSLRSAGLQYVIFGHIGDNHLHVNILPRSEAELGQALGLYEEFARRVVAMGGSVSAEHGIGRIKRALLRIQFGPEVVSQMRRIKEVLDPGGLLNPGVMF